MATLSPQKRTAITARLAKIDARRSALATEEDSLVSEAEKLTKGTDIRWFRGTRGRASNAALLTTLVLSVSGDAKKPSTVKELKVAVVKAGATDAARPEVVIVQKLNADNEMKLAGQEVIPSNLFKQVSRGKYILTAEGRKHRRRLQDAARRNK